MKELSLREIQLGELEVLKKLVQICDEQGLRYFLMYGTLLGAIRHKGFIPWDDDVDVAMPRSDFEKLLRYCREHQESLKPFVIMHYTINSDYIYPIARLCDTRYFVDYQGAKEYGLGLFVDIYPFDGCGNSEQEAQNWLRSNEWVIKMIGLLGQDKFTGSSKGLLRTVLKFVAYCLGKTIGIKHFLDKLDRKCKQREYENCKYVGCSNWELHTASGECKGYYERVIFDKIVKMEFEGCMFKVPSAYAEVLRNKYTASFMQLPAESERIGHHHYKAYKR